MRSKVAEDIISIEAAPDRTSNLIRPFDATPGCIDYRDFAIDVHMHPAPLLQVVAVPDSCRQHHCWEPAFQCLVAGSLQFEILGTEAVASTLCCKAAVFERCSPSVAETPRTYLAERTRFQSFDPRAKSVARAGTWHHLTQVRNSSSTDSVDLPAN